MRLGGNKNPRREFRNSSSDRTGRKVRPLRPSAIVPLRKISSFSNTVPLRKTRPQEGRSGFFKHLLIGVKTLCLLFIVTGAAGSLGWVGYQAIESHGFLALREVTVVGNHLLSKSLILEKAALELGSKLPWIPVGHIETKLSSLPGVGEVNVKRIFPSRIEIQIEEKQPVAMGYSKKWFGLSSDGSTLTGLNWAETDLPVVDGFAAMDSAHRVAMGNFLDVAKQTYPDLYDSFSQLCFQKNSNVVEIILREDGLKVLIDIVTTSNGSKSLNSLEFLQELKRQQSASLEVAKVIDLRVEGLAYVH